MTDQEGRVQQWNDRSDRHLEAMAIGDAVNWPLYMPAAASDHPAVGFGTVGTGPAVRRLQIEDDPGLWFGSGEFALIVVLRYRNLPISTNPDLQYGSIYQKVCDCPGFVGIMLFANDVWDQYLNQEPSNTSFLFEIAARSDYAARSPLTGFNDNQVHVLVARRSRDELGVEVDGLPHATALVTSTLDVSNPGVPLTIGAHGTQDLQALEGEIFEFVAVKGTTQVETMESCMLRKYGLQN